MKTKLFSLLLFLMGCFLFSKAQDTTLPQGKSTIFLLSGKIINEVRLWKINSKKIEYVKNGNLADVNTADVSTIVFSDGSQKIFNKTNESPGVAIKNKKARSADSSWTFRRFHIYFGKGGNIPAAEAKYNKAFIGSPYVGTLRDNNGSIYALGGNPQLNFSEDVFLGLEYNLNSQIAVGTWFRPFSGYFNGFEGDYDIAYHSVNERISGVRYCFNGSYALLHTTKPFRIEVNGGVSLILFLGNVNTNISFYDSSRNSVSPPASKPQLVDEFGRKDRFSGAAVEMYAIANLYLGKRFSVFIKPYATYDEGFSVSAKTFASHNQIADIPKHAINFTGYGILGGIAFHFGKAGHDKLKSVVFYSETNSTNRIRPAHESGRINERIINAKESGAIKNTIEADSDKKNDFSPNASDSAYRISPAFKGDSAAQQTTAVENKTVNAAEPITKKETSAVEPRGDGPKVNGFVLAGFICFLLAHITLLLGLLLWPLGIIFSIIGLHKIKKHPGKWKGKELAKTVLIIAGVEIILALVIVLLFLLLFPNGLGGFGG